jgi:hypothetical protein
MSLLGTPYVRGGDSRYARSKEKVMTFYEGEEVKVNPCGAFGLIPAGTFHAKPELVPPGTFH